VDTDLWSLSDANPPYGSEQTLWSLPEPWGNLLSSTFFNNF